MFETERKKERKYEKERERERKIRTGMKRGKCVRVRKKRARRVSDVIRKCLTHTTGGDNRDRWGRGEEKRASRRAASAGRSMTSREFARNYRTPVADVYSRLSFSRHAHQIYLTRWNLKSKDTRSC